MHPDLKSISKKNGIHERSLQIALHALCKEHREHALTHACMCALAAHACMQPAPPLAGVQQPPTTMGRRIQR